MQSQSSTELLDDGQVRARIRDRLDSKAWWCIPLLTARACSFTAELEERWVRGRQDRVFELLIGNCGNALGVAFFHKNAVPIKPLARILKQPTATLRTQDVLFCVGTAKLSAAELRRCQLAMH